MHFNEKAITDFYTCFGRRDYAGMIAHYAPQIHFTDPVFDLHGPRAGGMWHMLCESGQDLRVTFANVQADEQQGRAHWEAWYTFSTTGRAVHNVIEARFQFENGQIVRHVDSFSFWRWSRQALGTTGLLLGWSPILRNKVQSTANRNLDRFLQARGE
ncbi:MAG: nuclear transport factor 2 family protein [Ardenticatenales bacterium]|nr:nuclear transport factor 2 family protein [Ardenticatenales bacterium]